MLEPGVKDPDLLFAWFLPWCELTVAKKIRHGLYSVILSNFKWKWVKSNLNGKYLIGASFTLTLDYIGLNPKIASPLPS
jgi:hypothetical protein